ncbi:MAG: DeoR/GlpR transcriptional regulator [Lachnospiraceae bacterium]|nr:DeoR/GlpR transcriptional regulator [Lachnospiraceae bacterium]
MIREERLDRILEFIDKHQYASVESLMTLVDASKSTIRRDLIQLNEEGKITFVRGGAASVNKNFLPESRYQDKQSSYIEEKQRIGAAAASLIRSGENVFVAPGTTTRMILSNLPADGHFSIVTNDILIANDLALSENVNVCVTGGWLRKEYYSVSGFQAEECIRGMKIGTAFIGCDAIDTRSGCFIANEDEVGFIHELIKASHRVVLVADHSKFYSNAFLKICDFSQIKVLITDSGVSEEVLNYLKKKYDMKIMVV